MAKIDDLKNIIEPTVTAMGFLLWGVDYVPSGRFSTLRIYIDHEQGISVDHCAEVSRQISAVLDVEDPIAGHYSLEVSSPGMDRPLYSLDQFAACAGEWAEIRLRQPFENRRKFKGVILGVEQDEVVLQVADEEFLLPAATIERARIIPNFSRVDNDQELDSLTSRKGLAE